MRDKQSIKGVYRQYLPVCRIADALRRKIIYYCLDKTKQMRALKTKLIFLFFIGCVISLNAQKLPDNWYNLDLNTDKVMGVSSNKAYETILKGKPSRKVIVAVIDGGVEVDHPDLIEHIWTNIKEIPNNGIDDDNNGYVDDIHGWDFIGGKTEDVEHDNLEITRIYKKYKSVFENNTEAIKQNPEHYKWYVLAKKEYLKKYAEIEKKLKDQQEIQSWMEKMQDQNKERKITTDDVNNFPDGDSLLQQFKLSLFKSIDKGLSFEDVKKNIDSRCKIYNNQLNYNYNLDYDSRKIVGDHYDDSSERNYGNNEVEGPEASHGTHVAGIIGAVRNNNLGVDGVADSVSIMVLRVVPDGDERDKDIANAIRYAAENGASIINMSFGKSFPYDKNAVDNAVRFAVSKDVLFIHASGNESLNLDSIGRRYPNPDYANGKGSAKSNWIVVGAVAASGNPGPFSNYGRKKVDVFAPGVAINSTILDGKYGKKNGTSMACPVVAGVAAMIRSYHPDLSARKVKKIILKTVYKPTETVPQPGNDKVKISWKKLCKTAGIVNAYNALNSIR